MQIIIHLSTYLGGDLLSHFVYVDNCEEMVWYFYECSSLLLDDWPNAAV